MVSEIVRLQPQVDFLPDLAFEIRRPVPRNPAGEFDRQLDFSRRSNFHPEPRAAEARLDPPGSVSDPLMVPKTVARMRDAGFDEAQIDQLVWGNPTSFFAQGGRLDPAAIGELLPVDRRETFTGNSILRGQDPNAK